MEKRENFSPNSELMTDNLNVVLLQKQNTKH